MLGPHGGCVSFLGGLAFLWAGAGAELCGWGKPRAVCSFWAGLTFCPILAAEGLPEGSNLAVPGALSRKKLSVAGAGTLSTRNGGFALLLQPGRPGLSSQRPGPWGGLCSSLGSTFPRPLLLCGSADTALDKKHEDTSSEAQPETGLPPWPHRTRRGGRPGTSVCSVKAKVKMGHSIQTLWP